MILGARRPVPHNEPWARTGQAPTTDDLSVKKWAPHEYAQWMKRLRDAGIFSMNLNALAGEKEVHAY